MEFFLFILMNTNFGLKKFYLVSSKRAKEIFVALDTNGDGAITEDEFVRLGSGFSGERIYQIYIKCHATPFMENMKERPTD